MEDLEKEIEDLIASKKEKKEAKQKEASKQVTTTKQKIFTSVSDIIASKEKEARLAKLKLQKEKTIISENIDKKEMDAKKEPNPIVKEVDNVNIVFEKQDVIVENNTTNEPVKENILKDSSFITKKESNPIVKEVDAITKEADDVNIVFEKQSITVENTAINKSVKENTLKDSSFISKKEIITQLRLAKTGHKQWIANIHILVRLGNIEETKSTIPISFTACGFGKWYYGEGQMLAEFEEYQNLEKAHQKIHDIYLQIYNLYKGKIASSLFNSEKKQLKEREKQALTFTKNLDFHSDILFKNLLLLENLIKKLSDEKMADLNLF